MRASVAVVLLFLILCSVAVADEKFREQEILIPATSDATTFTAPVDGLFRFTITAGAAQTCPPHVAPEHPEWHGWNTRVLIYKNRPPEWRGGLYAPEHPDPSNWDFSIGHAAMQPTFGTAEHMGKGLSERIFLKKDEYVTLLVWDCRGSFRDNSGEIHLLVSLLPEPGHDERNPDKGSACDTFDLLGEGKKVVETFSGTKTVRFGWEHNEYRTLEAHEQFRYAPGIREAFGKKWDFARLGVIRTIWQPVGFGTTLIIWKSERYGEARGRTLCDETAWEASTGPEIGETFRLVGTVDQPFSAPFIPDASRYDFAWTLEQTVADVKKSVHPRHGEYVSHVTWEYEGTVYAKPNVQKKDDDWTALMSAANGLESAVIDGETYSYVKGDEGSLSGETAVRVNVRDPAGNLQGDVSKAFADVVQVDLELDENTYVLSVHTAAPFPAPQELGNDKRLDILFYADFDRDMRGGKFGLGADCNVHIFLDNKGWGCQWYEVTDTPQPKEVSVYKDRLKVEEKQNQLLFSFPKSHFPVSAFDWWINCGFNYKEGWSPIAANPATRRSSFFAHKEAFPVSVRDAEIVQLPNDAEPLPLPRYPRWGPLVRIERLWEYVKIYWVYVYLAIAAILISLYFLRDMLQRIYYRRRPLPTGRLLLLDAPARTNTCDVNIWLLARKRKKKRLVVGSDENADIRLAHRSIGPGHAEIFARRFEGGPATYIRRLGAGCVEVNVVSKEITPLANDAEVVIGDFRFKYEKPCDYRQVQARFKNGKILEGVPATWDINDKGFLMIPSAALSWRDSRFVRFDKLKGVYFMQDWDEDVRKRLLKTEKDLKGRPSVVRFEDDEVLHGYLLGNYHDQNKRFYFVLEDQSGETVYILVESSSVKYVRICGED